MQLGSLKEISDWLKDHDLSELILIKKFYSALIEKQNKQQQWESNSMQRRLKRH